MGWVCEGGPGRVQWHCEQRRLGNGPLAAEGDAARSQRVPESDDNNGERALPQSRPAVDQGADDAPALTPGLPGAGSDSDRDLPGVGSSAAPSSGRTEDHRYTIQLGAFSSADRRQRFVAQRQLQSLALDHQKAERQGRTLWLITYGDFASREAAEEAHRQLAEDYPGLDAWIRRRSFARADSE